MTTTTSKAGFQPRWRILGAAVAGAALVVVGVTAVAQQRASAWFSSQLAQSLDATVTVGSVDASLFSDFPRIDFRVRDVMVTGRDSFEGIRVLEAGEVGFGLDLRSAWMDDRLEIASVRLTDAQIHVVFDEQGLANYDIFGSSEAEPDEDDAAIALQITQIALSEVAMVVEDRAGDTHTEITGLNLEANASVDGARARFESQGTIDSLSVASGGVQWLKATQWTSDMVVNYDQTTGAIEFGDNEVVVNALPLAFRGTATPQADDWQVDLAFEVQQTDFGALLSLVPEAYTEQFDQVDAQGQVAFEGHATGLYKSEEDHLPAFEVTLNVTDASFRYPDLPNGVDQIEASLFVRHEEGPSDRSTIEIRRFGLGAGGSTLSGRATLTRPVSDPTIDATVSGAVDLGALSRAMPRDPGAQMEGMLEMEMRVAGASSAFERGDVRSVTAEGRVSGRGISLSQPDSPPLEVDVLDLVLSPKSASVNPLSVDYAGSRFSVVGQIDNLVSWLLSDEVLLRGDLALSGPVLDLRPFQVDEDDPSEPASETVLVAVPENVDLTVQASVDEVRSEQFDLEDVDGVLVVRAGEVRMQDVTAKMFGGEAAFSGSYLAPTTDSAEIDLKVDAFEFDLPTAMTTFASLRAVVPILNQATGRFDSGFSLAATLASDGTPDLSKISSAGLLVPRGVSITTPVVHQVTNALNQTDVRALEVSGARVRYAFEQGQVTLRPFNATLGSTPMTVSGSAGVLDRSLDLDLALTVPTQTLGNVPFLAGLDAVPELADVVVSLTGTWDKPSVGVGLAGTAQVGDAVRNQLESEVDNRLDEAIAQAREAGDRLVSEAKAARDALVAEAAVNSERIRVEARRQADRLRDEAAGNPLKQVAANEAAKLVESEADKLANGVDREARKAGNQLVREARTRAEELIAAAEQRTATD